MGKLKATELLKQYNTHQFYLQLSTSEGFPNALGEAMACGCVPIGSAVGAIPEIIDKTGFLLFRKEINELEALILGFDLSKSKQLSAEASLRIKK
ncbi:glycosyltransferase [Algoriphagus boritolerans]|uniref:glycosyltransferase n=1 Tax=Algoriphagus boritolerans TaxID=308111 RepID=UPI002FCE1E3D